jgi:hypothetical protein
VISLFDEREHAIRRALRALARQRVALIVQDAIGQDLFVIEQAPDDRQDLYEALRTCHMRGWAEILSGAIPAALLTENGRLPSTFPQNAKPIYRLTYAGWAQLRRTHEWLIATFVVALLGTAAAIMALVK